MTGRSIAAVGLAVALLLGACQTDRKVTKPDPVPVTEKLLKGALLTEKDLPSGWTKAANATPVNADVISNHKCDDKLKELDPKTSSSVDFTSSGTRLTNTLAYFPGGGGAVEQLFSDVAKDCEEVVITSKNESVRAAPLDFGVLSKDTLPTRFEIEPTTGPIQERDLILIRNGDLVSIVRLNGLRPSDKALLDTAVRTSIGRLGLVADQT